MMATEMLLTTFTADQILTALFFGACFIGGIMTLQNIKSKNLILSSKGGMQKPIDDKKALVEPVAPEVPPYPKSFLIEPQPDSQVIQDLPTPSTPSTHSSMPSLDELPAEEIGSPVVVDEETLRIHTKYVRIKGKLIDYSLKREEYESELAKFKAAEAAEAVKEVAEWIPDAVMLGLFSGLLFGSSDILEVMLHVVRDQLLQNIREYIDLYKIVQPAVSYLRETSKLENGFTYLEILNYLKDSIITGFNYIFFPSHTFMTPDPTQTDLVYVEYVQEHYLSVDADPLKEEYVKRIIMDLIRLAVTTSACMLLEIWKACNSGPRI